MSQPNLTEDLNIVANSNIEITLLDGDLNIIQKLDDEPNDVGGLTSAELKAKFDEGSNKIKTFLNESLIPELLAADATEAARAAAEAQREANETQRIENENARIAAEQARVDETSGVVAQANQAAQSWAVGGTGTREGEDTNNAKYWSDKAREAAGGDFVPTSEKGAANGVATLGSDGKVPSGQMPSLDYVPNSEKGKENGVATLGADGKVPAGQVDAYSKSDSISAETRTALSLAETATPDAALAEIARQLSERTKLLWENASPTSSFPAQSISVNTDGYAGIIVSFVGLSTDFQGTIGPDIVNMTIGTEKMTVWQNSAIICYRPCTWTSTSEITFSDAREITTYGNSSNRPVINNNAIPYRIYGIKL